MPTVSDSMGSLEIPPEALYGAQTQRAINNFPISGIAMPHEFIKTLSLIKAACAHANMKLKLLDKVQAKAIISTAFNIVDGKHYEQFPIDVFQTGSGTSTNMNMNEVIANIAKNNIHPNDHVNMCQSSNDIIPTTIQLSCAYTITNNLLPALDNIVKALDYRSNELSSMTKTGRTHLMDALPITFGQELSGWSSQIKNNINRIKFNLLDLIKLPIGGTAIGTGLNAHPRFAKLVCKYLKKCTKLKIEVRENYFEAISSQDSVAATSASLKTLAISLMKISNDLRWMNSGPLTGISEISLPAVQPGSSIMPGKINPVISESVCMVCAQVIGNDTTITMAAQSGNFQLNVMLPVIAYNTLQSIDILSNAINGLESVVKEFKINEDNIAEKLELNPILITALNSKIGYDKGAKIAKRSYNEGKPILEIAAEETDLSLAELKLLLDPLNLTKGGIN